MQDHKTTPTMLVTEAASVFSLQDLKAWNGGSISMKYIGSISRQFWPFD
jgi:hypothetical protein